MADVEHITIEDGQEYDVNYDTDYACEDCSTDLMIVFHRRDVA